MKAMGQRMDARDDVKIKEPAWGFGRPVIVKRSAGIFFGVLAIFTAIVSPVLPLVISVVVVGVVTYVMFLQSLETFYGDAKTDIGQGS